MRSLLRRLLRATGRELVRVDKAMVLPRPTRGPEVYACPGLDWNEPAVDAFLSGPLEWSRGEWSAFPERPALGEPLGYHVGNPYFSLVDAAVMHALLRSARPRLVVEVGSGYSSRLIASALARNGSGRLVCVDPEPRVDVAGLGAEVHRARVETLPVSFFDALFPGDILSIDSSHRAGQGSDVNFLFLEVLPALAPGVLVHVHDIYLPEDYPAAWNVDEAWGYSEQYLLHALLTGSSLFRVRWPGRWVLRNRRERLRELFGREDLVHLVASFWIERT